MTEESRENLTLEEGEEKARESGGPVRPELIPEAGSVEADDAPKPLTWDSARLVLQEFMPALSKLYQAPASLTEIREFRREFPAPDFLAADFSDDGVAKARLAKLAPKLQEKNENLIAMCERTWEAIVCAAYAMRGLRDDWDSEAWRPLIVTVRLLLDLLSELGSERSANLTGGKFRIREWASSSTVSVIPENAVNSYVRSDKMLRKIRLAEEEGETEEGESARSKRPREERDDEEEERQAKRVAKGCYECGSLNHQARHCPKVQARNVGRRRPSPPRSSSRSDTRRNESSGSGRQTRGGPPPRRRS